MGVLTCAATRRALEGEETSREAGVQGGSLVEVVTEFAGQHVALRVHSSRSPRF